jgi:ZIP family zinc transporter/zinc and cadmium transporter
MSPLVQAILFALAAASANIAGGVIVTSSKWAKTSLRFFIALGAGFMLGAVFLEMAPESFRLASSEAPMLILAGYAIVHMFEHTFASHLHFGEETHHDELANPIVGFSALIGMLVHTFFDGVAIGAGFMVSEGFGLLLFLAVFLHKIPDGFTISSIVITSGYSNRYALGATVALGISTILGVLAVYSIGDGGIYALPISTGSMLYVAATDLMPEVNRESGVKMAFVVFGGMGLFLILRTLAHA